jgi:thymidylate synthase-like protein
MKAPLQRIDNVLGDWKGFVELQDMMPNPLNGIDEHEVDRAVVQAARVSFLGESKGDEADKKLLFYLLEHHHTTPFEQVEFKFRVKAPVVVFGNGLVIEFGIIISSQGVIHHSRKMIFIFLLNGDYKARTISKVVMVLLVLLAILYSVKTLN